MTATTIPIVCVSHADILMLLRRKEALRRQRPLPAGDDQILQLVGLLDELRQTNQQIVEWLAQHIPAELLAQAAEIAAGGGR